jgi:hypothetical protein
MIFAEVNVEVTPAMLRVNRIAGRFSNFVPLVGGRVDVITRQLIKRQFATQGRAAGRGRWRSLRPWYAEWKRSIGKGRKPIMRLTDRLYNALTKRAAVGQVVQASQDRYVLTVTQDLMPRLRAHQLGLSNNPVRQVIPKPPPKSYMEELRKATRSYVIS